MQSPSASAVEVRETRCAAPAALQPLSHVPAAKVPPLRLAVHVPPQQGPTQTTAQSPVPGIASEGTPLQLRQLGLLKMGWEGPRGVVLFPGEVLLLGGGVVLFAGVVTGEGALKLEFWEEGTGAGAPGVEVVGEAAGTSWRDNLFARERVNWVTATRLERANAVNIALVAMTAQRFAAVLQYCTVASGCTRGPVTTRSVGGRSSIQDVLEKDTTRGRLRNGLRGLPMNTGTTAVLMEGNVE